MCAMTEMEGLTFGPKNKEEEIREGIREELTDAEGGGGIHQEKWG